VLVIAQVVLLEMDILAVLAFLHIMAAVAPMALVVQAVLMKQVAVVQVFQFLELTMAVAVELKTFHTLAQVVALAEEVVQEEMVQMDLAEVEVVTQIHHHQEDEVEAVLL
jgi:hypothetical protein